MNSFRKGQGVNIDWTVGLAVFLVSMLSGMILAAAMNVDHGAVDETRQAASLVQQALEEETYVTGRQAPLIVHTPSETGKIPIDRDYIFPEEAYPGSGAMDTPADIDIPDQRVTTVVGGKNTTHSLSYFFEDNANISYQEENDIETGDRMENTYISVKPESPGLQSLQINGNEILNDNADLNGGDFSIEEHEIHASTLDGDLKLYNGSTELILEDAGDVEFYLKDFDDLYWYADESTTTLDTTSTYKSGETKGFTIASDYGITFMGEDLEATVSKTDSSTVEADITDASRLRIYLHDSGTEAGEDRIEFFDEGDIVFGAEEVIEGADQEKVEELAETSERNFENRLDLDDVSYNIAFGPWLKDLVAEQQDWNTGSFEGTSADRKDNSGDLGLGYRNGTAGDSLVGYWRLDREVAGDGGTVIDYSGEKNDGATVNDVETGAPGVFGTNAFEFDGEDSKVDIDSPLLGTEEATICSWMRRERTDLSHDWGHGIVNDYENTDGERNFLFREYPAGSVRYGFGDGSSIDTGTIDMGIEAFKWHHVCIRFQGSDSKSACVDGDCVSSSTSISSLGENDNDNAEIGQYRGTAPMDGKIDEIKIYDRALSEEEIKELYFHGEPFKGNYTRSESFDTLQSWESVRADASVPADTSLEMEFEAVRFGSVVDSQTFGIQDGEEEYQLSLEETDEYRVVFRGESEDVEKSWEVKEFEVEHGPMVKRGQTLPFRDVVVSDSPSVMLGRYGNFSIIDSRVAVWR